MSISISLSFIGLTKSGVTISRSENGACSNNWPNLLRYLSGVSIGAIDLEI